MRAAYHCVSLYVSVCVCVLLFPSSLTHLRLRLHTHTAIQVKRQEHLCKKVIHRIPDEIDYENDRTNMQYVHSAEYYTSNVQHQKLSDATRFFVHTKDAGVDDDGR